MKKWKIHEQYQVATDSIAVYLIEENLYTGQRAIMKPCILEAVAPGLSTLIPPEPWLHEQSDFRAMLQAFLDLAWSKGLRPKDFADHADQLIATQDHLKDMRALVGGMLEIKLPGATT